MQRYPLSDYTSEELNLLKRLDSPYIISFYDSFVQGDIFCILTEYCQVRNKKISLWLNELLIIHKRVVTWLKELEIKKDLKANLN